MYKYYDEAKRYIDNFITIFVGKTTQNFYRIRIEKFFIDYMGKDHNSQRPMKTITFHDINQFLNDIDKSEREKVNYYAALKSFFEYTYELNITNDVMRGVDAPKVERKSPEYITKEDVEKIKEFILNENNDIKDRLFLGFFLYTGLSRQYIANLRNYQISSESIEYTLHIEKRDQSFCLPIKKELQDLIKEYRMHYDIVNPYEKIFDFDENYFSTKISELSKKCTGKKYTPTHYSNTFIKVALETSNDIYSISRLTLESLATIRKHISNDNNIFNYQKEILKDLFTK